jgi:hypothetical protein
MKKLVVVALGLGLWAPAVNADDTHKFVLVKFKNNLEQSVQNEHIEKLKTLNDPTTQLLEISDDQMDLEIADVVLLSAQNIDVKIQSLLPDTDVDSILTFHPPAVDLNPKNARNAAKILNVFDELLKNSNPTSLAENIVTVSQNIDVLQHLHSDQKQKLIRGLNRAMTQMLQLYLLSVNSGAGEVQSPLLELSKLSHISLNRLQTVDVRPTCAMQLSASL